MMSEMIRSLVANGPVDGYRIVTFSDPAVGNGVSVATSPARPLAGTTGKLGGAIDATLDVFIGGNPEVRLGGGVKASDPLTSDAAGRAVRADEGDFIIGFADEPGSLDAIIRYRPSPGVYRAGRIAFEADVTWDFSRFPLSVYRDRRGHYSTDWQAREHVPEIKAIFDGVSTGTTGVYYANAGAANDAGNGLTPQTAKQVARSAVILGEQDATKTAIIVYCLPGDYDRTKDFLLTSNAGGTKPSKPLALIALGQVNMGPLAAPGSLAWAPDGGDGSGKSYRVTRSASQRVINRLNRDTRFGKETPYILVADAAAVYASTGIDAFAFVGNDIVAKRADGLPVSEATTRVILQADACSPGAVPFYAHGIDFMGGISGCFQRNIATANPAVAEECWFLYPGKEGVTTGSPANCITVDGACLTALVRCGYGYPNADHVNQHGFFGRNHTLVLGLAGVLGFGGAISSQLLTGHGDDVTEASTRMIAIGVDGSGGASAGAARRFVGKSQLVEFGGVSDADRGDIAAGGQVISTGVQLDDQASAWLYEHYVRRCARAYTVASAAKLFVRGGSPGGGLMGGIGRPAAF